jgi:hypothetical protein
MYADLSLICKAQVTSGSLLTDPLNFRPRAEKSLRMVPNLGLLSPDKAL